MRKNRYSRQWLVNPHDESVVKGQRGVLSHDDRGDDRVTARHHLHHQHSIHQRVSLRIIRAVRRCIGVDQQHIHVKQFVAGHFQRPQGSRVESRFYQILEVLLAIVLVNFLVCKLTHLPVALAAFGEVSSGRRAFSGYGSSHNAETNFDDRERTFLDSEEEDGEPYYRQPHSIGGSAFGYNGLQLQHNLDDNLLRSQNFKISPKPCSIGRIEGTCMFVWECIKSEGRHVGMCVDSFMFGSCCAHNYTDNIVLPNTFSYTRPTKPVGMGSMNHRPRPPQHPHRPSIM